MVNCEFLCLVLSNKFKYPKNKSHLSLAPTWSVIILNDNRAKVKLIYLVTVKIIRKMLDVRAFRETHDQIHLTKSTCRASSY